MEREILYNQAQRLEFCCPEGQPSGDGTIAIKQNDGTTAFAGSTTPTTTATAETTDLALSAESGRGQANPALLNMASVSGLEINRTYQLYEAGRASQWVVPQKIVGTTVYLRLGLDEAYTASAKLRSTWIYADLLATDVDAYALFQPGVKVTWSYAVGGTSYSHTVTYDFVRQDTLTPPLDALDLLDKDPDLLQGTASGSKTLQLSNAIRFCWGALRRELRAAHVELQRVLELDVFDDVLYWDVVIRLAGRGQGPFKGMAADQFIEFSRRERLAAWKTAIAALQYADDADDVNQALGDDDWSAGMLERV